MPQITVTSPLLYLSILFLIVGVFLVLAGQDVIKVEKVTVTKSKKTSVFGLMLVGLGVVFLLPELSKSVPPYLPEKVYLAMLDAGVVK